MNIETKPAEYVARCQQCGATSVVADSERSAESWARKDGYIESNGRTLCNECAPKRAKAPK